MFGPLQKVTKIVLFQKVLMSEIFDISLDNFLESLGRHNRSNQFDKCLDYKCATKLIPSWVRTGLRFIKTRPMKSYWQSNIIKINYDGSASESSYSRRS